MQISTRIGVVQAIAGFPRFGYRGMILLRDAHRRKPARYSPTRAPSWSVLLATISRADRHKP
jgi:hypothetical protein